LPALGHIDDHLGGAHCFNVTFGSGDDDGRFAMKNAVAAAWLEAVMPATSRGTMEASSRATTQRTGRTKRSGLPGAPVHVFGPIEGDDFFGELGGEKFSGSAAGSFHGDANVLTLGRGHLFKSRNVDARLLRKGLRCGCGSVVL